MKKIILALFVFVFIPFASGEEKGPWQVSFDKYTKGLPADVVGLLIRMDKCDHWAGEEPYDEARKKEIDAGFAKSKCDSLDKDKEAVLKKYRKQPQVIKKIKGFPDALN